MTTIIGIDCATEDKRVGLACGKLTAERVEVTDALSNLKQGGVLSKLREWLAPTASTLLAIDAPLGWPREMGTALFCHKAGQPIAIEPNRLFRRRTDIYIKERLSQQPLDVGADRIARTAHRALQLIEELRTSLSRPIDLAWEPVLRGLEVIEVYPAATLVSYKIPARCYKDEGGTEARSGIVKRLSNHIHFKDEQLKQECLADADVLDAVICVLAGADFLLGRAEAPREEDVELARKEGWIWCRNFELLAPNPGLAADA